ncbi:MAG: serine hydrolase domain-containing protein, partial [Myxococcota bacterium]
MTTSGDGDLEQTLQAILEDGVARGIYSGAQAGVLVDDGPMHLWNVGHTAWLDSVPRSHTRRPVDGETRFDVASLTKAVVTAPLVWYAVAEGRLSLDGSIQRWLPDWVGAREGVTVRHLLTHTSGLPAWLPLYEEGSPEAIWRRLLALKPEAAPGTQAVYSDMGFLLLGLVLERCLGAELDQLAQSLLMGPLGMKATRFVRHREGATLAAQAAATEATAVASHQGQALVGEVHDENAWSLGGVAAHAGLFSTAHDMLVWGRALLGADQAPGAPWAIPSGVVRWMLSEQGGAQRSEQGQMLGTHLG